MLNQLRGHVLLGILSLLLTQGCTAMRPVQATGGDAATAQLRIGDQIRLVDGVGQRVDLEVTEIGADYLVGEMPDRGTIRFAFADLREIERREPAKGRTAALVGIGVLALMGVNGLGEIAFFGL